MLRAPALTEQERELLQTVVDEHELTGKVLIHANMPKRQHDLAAELSVKGYLEIRYTAKHTHVDHWVLVPTPRGRRMIAELEREDEVKAEREGVAA